MSRIGDLVERAALWLDRRFRDAHREPDAMLAKCPAGCACIRCDKTVPEDPCRHPAAERYELDSRQWVCGACGDPCEPPAVTVGLGDMDR